LTQQDFARRLNTTPKNLSLLIRGEQRLSTDMAAKLADLLGTSPGYWLNLQKEYDEVLAKIASDKTLQQDKVLLNDLPYTYFRDNFGLPDCPRHREQQVLELRRFLEVSSLSVLEEPALATKFRSSSATLVTKNIIKANAMTQIAINEARACNAPKYDKKRFEKAVEFALTQTRNHEGFYPLVRDAFLDAGVVLVILPNMPGSKINGATKRLGDSIMLMVNDRHRYADVFWFTLLHEIGHIMNGDFGISLENETGESENEADRFARDKLIDPEKYQNFVSQGLFTRSSILEFADEIDRDPGIILGRLQHDGYVRHGTNLESLYSRYRIRPE
jgi:HTH-type transcriptional regulator/antitoxin HigA